MGRFLFLGTGASTGVPIIGCHCAICSSSSSYNKRLRPSGLVEWQGKRFLIDAGPDFRQQALHHHIESIDGLLLTHTHFDHIAGIDDLRVFAFRTKKPVPCLLSQESLDTLRQRYHYLFEKSGESKVVQMEFQVVHDESVEFQGTHFKAFHFYQASMPVLGFRFGSFAFVSDIRSYDDSIFKALAGVDTLVLSALREEKSPLHLSIEEAVQFARTVGAKQTWLTHISHFIDHEVVNNSLPPDIRIGYDGLEFFFD